MDQQKQNTIFGYVMATTVKIAVAIVVVVLAIAAIVGSIALLCWLWHIFMGVVA